MSGDGRFLLAQRIDGPVIVYDLERKHAIWSSRVPHDLPDLGVDMSHDGSHVALLDRNDHISVINVRTGKEMWHSTSALHTSFLAMLTPTCVAAKSELGIYTNSISLIRRSKRTVLVSWPPSQNR
jgi:hypothetical protein